MGLIIKEPPSQNYHHVPYEKSFCLEGIMEGSYQIYGREVPEERSTRSKLPRDAHYSSFVGKRMREIRGDSGDDDDDDDDDDIDDIDDGG